MPWLMIRGYSHLSEARHIRGASSAQPQWPAAGSMPGVRPMTAKPSGPSFSTIASTAITVTTWPGAGRSTSCRPLTLPLTPRRGARGPQAAALASMPPAGGPHPDAQTVDRLRVLAPRTRSTRCRRRAGARPRLVAASEPPRVRERHSRSSSASRSTPRCSCPRTTSRAISTTTPTRCRCRRRSSASTSTPRARSPSKPSATRKRCRSARHRCRS